MAVEGQTHWSKDFVEHLRTVHFALILVASALIITGTSTESTRMTAAFTQIQQIAKFERNWPTVPSRIYEQVLLDSNIDTQWSKGLAMVLPQTIYRDREIDTFMEIPKETVVGKEPWRFSGKAMPTEMSDLADFRDFWNALNHHITLILPEAPDQSSFCNVDVRIDHSDGSNDLLQDDQFDPPANRIVCKVDVGLLSAIGGPTIKMRYNIDSSGDDFTNPFLELWVWSDLPLQKASLAIRNKAQAIVGITTIHLNARKKEIDESYLKRLYFSDWQSGPFKTAFRELDSVSSGISTVEINDATRRVESQVDSLEKNISLAGFTIPISQISRWGALILLSTQLYLWLHLHEFAAKVQPDAEGWDVAWIGLYRSRFAQAISVITCLGLPFAAAAVVAARIVAITFYYRRTAMAVSACIVLSSAILGSATIWKLIQIRTASSGEVHVGALLEGIEGAGEDGTADSIPGVGVSHDDA